jgi:sugar phosphate isomerase/epimerase
MKEWKKGRCPLFPASHPNSSNARTPLGFSTSWNASGVEDGSKIVDQIKRLGFRALEVEYRVSESAVTGIEEAVKADEIQVLSVHNYSPLAAGEKASTRGGDKGNLASPDDHEAAEAVKLAERSLDLACGLGAGVLIVHAGETDMNREYFHELSEIVETEGVLSGTAARLRQAVIRERDAKRGPYLEAALNSIKELEAYAAERGIKIGIENRYYYHQVPLPEEIIWMIERLNSPYVGYWHDVGHAHVMEILGFVPHLNSLDLLKGNLLGMHLHDSVFIRDHRAPGTGEIDFPAILGRAPLSAIKVIELADFVTEDDIRQSTAYLESMGVRA